MSQVNYTTPTYPMPGPNVTPTMVCYMVPQNGQPIAPNNNTTTQAARPAVMTDAFSNILRIIKPT